MTLDHLHSWCSPAHFYSLAKRRLDFPRRIPDVRQGGVLRIFVEVFEIADGGFDREMLLCFFRKVRCKRSPNGGVKAGRRDPFGDHLKRLGVAFDRCLALLTYLRNHKTDALRAWHALSLT